MAFISEEINNKEDGEYFCSIAVTSMTGDKLKPGWWTIDRDRDIILYGRGGGSFEIPVGYALYVGGHNVEIEVTEATEGGRHKNNLKVRYFIKRIKIPEILIRQEYQVSEIVDIIKEAFEAMGVPYVERSQILELHVKIVTEAEIIKEGEDRI